MKTADKAAFIREMHKIKLMGGRKLTYQEVLLREVEKGNEKAIELYKKWEDKLKED